MLSKVDRANSLEEITRLEESGVDLISFDIAFPGSELTIEDGRSLDPRRALELRGNVRKARTVAMLDFVGPEPEWIRSKAEVFSSFDYVQATSHQLGYEGVLPAVRGAGRPVICSQIIADYDMDPSWIRGEIEDPSRAGLKYYEIQVVTGVQNSWRNLKEESPKHEEELQVSDLRSMTLDFPLFFALDFSLENVEEILKAFPRLEGWTITLGGDPESSLRHFHTAERALEVLGREV
ncbi:MAG: hypothetical protein O7H41_19795 [Planctomycetota bacterium]|nr:hypothetical protein [Planctomycetota bacterium]